MAFGLAALDWFNAYHDNALQVLMRLYDTNATQACTCGARKLIQGKQALSAYWLEHFKTHPVDGLERLVAEKDGASLSYRTNDTVVHTRLTFNEDGKIAQVICGPEDVAKERLGNRASFDRAAPLSSERKMLLDHYELAERHVGEGARRVAQQRQLVAKLVAEGRDPRYAKTLLLRFEEQLIVFVADRDRLLGDLRIPPSVGS